MYVCLWMVNIKCHRYIFYDLFSKNSFYFNPFFRAARADNQVKSVVSANFAPSKRKCKFSPQLTSGCKNMYLYVTIQRCMLLHGDMHKCRYIHWGNPLKNKKFSRHDINIDNCNDIELRVTLALYWAFLQ